MDPATVARVLYAISDLWSVASDAEITMEANPTSVEATRFKGYRAAGVNRLSLGVQALNDPT
jgi:coproporphyrinogen III oxidase-like Fe-S oxidoreductase